VIGGGGGDDDDDDDENNNSVQFNSYLLTCLFNSQVASSTSDTTYKTNNKGQ
jgi:hypothetical protein